MAQQPPRPVMVEPAHLTEFASARYFEKLSQQSQQQNQQQVDQHGPGGPSSAGAPFILPLRGLKTPAAEEAAHQPELKKKKRLGISFFHKPSLVVPSEPQEQTKPLVGEAYPRPSLPFDSLFLNLPTELQIQVIASLPLSDILNMRRWSRAFHAIITANEGPIARYHLDHQIPSYAKRLYPPPDPSSLSLHYVCGLWHRLHIAAKLSSFICEWVTKEIFLRTTETQRLEFAPQRERMRRRLIPLLFTIYHFFETYRARHIQFLQEHNGKGLLHTPYTLNPIEAEVMSMYDDRTLLQVHQVFPLVVASFCRRLRPPSYVGRVERTVRGYLKEKPADEIHVAALCIGGLRQVERFWEIKGYNCRRGEVDRWYNSIITTSRAPLMEVPQPTLKPRRGLMGLGRKKSSLTIREAAKASSGDVVNGTRESMESNLERRNSVIWSSSLSQGMPMGPLPQETLDLLVPDLPVLQQMWLTTAEALILERKIVERPADIKKNAQVMLDLIREDGIADEDEWWYGQGDSPSVRPPLDAIDEDPIED
ncbi:uncharacterized protein E0L32_003052 [Thyridium curvatum]|uniref:F-box domain-containing protein n=1 Tax=Thyridium curvatum TaxID=1093900 RepID=A0A507BJ05_9PEZI|nr:uncharacterized protein E0L32_003052 [Thyridium curvatum]TPX17409.1 hypothetical protein E0L32_003052 [Thyridium curvatum]